MISKKLFALIFLGLFLTPIALPVRAQELIGCCEKTSKDDNNPKVDAEATTKKKCDEIKGDYKNTKWWPEKEAIGNVCELKVKIPPRELGEQVVFTPAVTIPGTKYVAGSKIPLAESTEELALYILAIFKYSIGAIGIISAIVIMMAGIMWLTAGGNSEKVGQARQYILSALGGLILALCSFLLLSTINTSLVKLKVTPVPSPDRIDFEPGCCIKKGENGEQTTENLLKDICVGLPNYVDFKPEFAAQENKCVEITGCCVLDIGTQTGILEWPFVDDTLCMNKVSPNTCNSQASKAISNWVPIRNFLVKDADADFKLAEKCQDVSDCDEQPICESAAECIQKLKKIDE